MRPTRLTEGRAYECDHVADLNPKTLESAKRQFVELYGSALVMNTYLKSRWSWSPSWPLACWVSTSTRSSRYSDVKPLVIRIDDVGTGRSGAVRRDELPAAAA